MTPRDADETALARALKALATTEAGVEIAPRVEAAIMARWDAAHASRVQSPRTARFVRRAATTAAGVTLLAALVWQRGTGVTPAAPAVPDTPLAPQTLATPRPGTAPAVPGEEYATAAFVGEPLSAEEPLRIVRMRVARSALTQLGISSTTQADTIDIEVLVGEDGVARGVRMPM